MSINLIFTAVRSPQSNGMSEAFVKTLKGHCASTIIVLDAETILAFLPQWVDLYCEIDTQSGLNYS